MAPVVVLVRVPACRGCRAECWADCRASRAGDRSCASRRAPIDSRRAASRYSAWCTHAARAHAPLRCRTSLPDICECLRRNRAPDRCADTAHANPAAICAPSASSAAEIFPSSPMRCSTRLRRASASVGIIQRRKFRSVDHPGQQRGFLQFQIGDRLAKIKLRRGGKTIVAVRQVHLVGIHRKNLRLGVAPLDLQRQQHFLHLAVKGLVAAVEKEVAGELHGDGAGARGDAVLQHVAEGCAGNAREIDAPVIFESAGPQSR